MKKIITALNNPQINEALKKEQNIEISAKDIQYKEGIIEVLHKNKNINLIIINEKIDGEIEINLLINEILKINNKIKIYLIIEEKKIEEIKEQKNLKIFNDKNLNNKKILQIIKSEKTIKEKEINKETPNLTSKNMEIKKISVNGAQGVGKSITSLIIANFFKNQKILIVESETKNQSLFNIILNKNKQKIISEINKNIDLISYKNTKKINIQKYNKIIYDNNKNYTNLKNIDINLIIIEPNIIGIKKAKNIIDKYINELKISNNKIKIIINKKNKYSLNNKIIKQIFFKIEIIGELKYNEKYEKIINNNLKNLKNVIFENKNQIYKNIIKKLN